ncbi:MAG: serine/threonine protein kinase [Acidobacteriia bacterium]|nr:serine/threonine protein kinase [Terriglobia bacterium]
MKVLQSVYGLLLETPLPVPGLQLQAERRDEDVRVHVRGVLAEGEFPFPITAQNFFYASPTLDDKGLPLVRAGWDTKENYFGFWYSDGAKFAVSREGCEIWADWPDGYTLEDACTYLVGPVLAFALRLRGATCLHASAIEVDGLAIALVGAPGAGKSTTAAAFALAGFPVLSDDIVVLSETNGRLFVQPGYPRVNVWPDSARALTGSAAALPLITPTWGKHFLPLGQNGLRFAGRPLPLGAVYLLAERQPELAAPVVEEISGSEAMVTLAANTYQNYLLDAEMRRKDFELFERLAKALPVRRIRRPDDISALASSCEAIAADARRMLARGIANEVPAGD